MKRLLLATFAVVTLGAGAASAADIAVAPAYKAPPPRPACAQFRGFYVGAHVGAIYYDHTWSDRDAWTSELSDDLQRSNIRSDKSGFIGGVAGGYNWQNNCTLFGLQADYGWTRTTVNVLETDSDVGIDLDSLTVQSKLKGFGTLRARTGVVVDNLLLYVTGGLAYGTFDRTYSQVDLNTPGTETFASRKSKWGWTAGFGTEWAIWGNWSIQSEVLYARFERDETSFLCTAAITCGAPGEVKRFEHQDSVWTTRIGINYRFGGGPLYGRN
jgi:outer membrane immunogenic protein